MSDAIEVWKPVSGFDDRYEVSNFGNVRSKIATRGHKPGHVMKPQRSKIGYWQINLVAPDGKPCNRRIHRLVALAFLGEPEPGMEVNHKDGDKNNNHIDNLEYTTRSGNMLHARQVLGWMPNIAGLGHHKGAFLKRLRDADMQDELCERFLRGNISVGRLADEYGIRPEPLTRLLKSRGIHPKQIRVTFPHDNSRSGHRSVFWNKRSNKYAVQIRRGGVSHFIGYFLEIEEAIQARDNFLQEYHK